MPDTNRWSRKYANSRLEQVARAARMRANKVYQSECGIDIDHIKILRIVAADPKQPVKSVVRESNLDRSLVSRMIGHLVRLNMLERIISPNDARQFLLATTSSGENLVSQANQLGDALDADLLGILTDEEREIFERCLAKLSQWEPSNNLARH